MNPIAANDAIDGPAMLDLDHRSFSMNVGLVERLDDDPVAAGWLELVKPSFGGGFVDILSAEQTEKTSHWYQGTADAVRRNLMHFRSEPHEYVLILSGDQLYRMDYRKIIKSRCSRSSSVRITHQIKQLVQV